MRCGEVMAINFLFDHTDVVRLLVKLRLAPRGQGATEGGRAAPHEAAAGAIDAGSHPSPEMNCYTYIDNDYDVCEDDMSDNRYSGIYVDNKLQTIFFDIKHLGYISTTKYNSIENKSNINFYLNTCISIHKYT